MRIIRLDDKRRVVQINEGNGTKMIEGFIESELGEHGQVMNEDGTFSEYILTAEEQTILNALLGL